MLYQGRQFRLEYGSEVRALDYRLNRGGIITSTEPSNRIARRLNALQENGVEVSMVPRATQRGEARTAGQD